MQIRIDDSDIKEMEKIINKMIKQSPVEMDELMKHTTVEIERVAKERAPVGNYPKHWAKKGGNLRKNIRKGKDKDGYLVKSDADYSLYVEYGHRNFKGKPFFRPAIEAGMKYLENGIRTRFKY